MLALDVVEGLSGRQCPGVFKLLLNHINATGSPEEKYKLAHRTIFRALLPYLVAYYYSIYKSKHLKVSQINRYMSSLRRPTDGTWVKLTKELAVFLEREFPSSYANLLFAPINSEQCHSMQSLVCFFRNEKDPFTIENKELTVIDFLEWALWYRNTFEHHFIDAVYLENVADLMAKAVGEMLTIFLPILETDLLFCVSVEESERKTIMVAKYLNNDLHTMVSIEYDSNIVDEENLYFLVGLPIRILPFVIFRDSYLVFYSGLDERGHCQYDNFITQKTIKVSSIGKSLPEIFEFDENVNFHDISVNVQTASCGIIHNLPKPTYKEFYGRKEIIQRILSALQHPKTFLITIDGIGGVGKTATVLKTCHDRIVSCTEQKRMFDYVVWISAKDVELTPKGVESIKVKFEVLEQLLDVILKMSGFLGDYGRFEKETKIAKVLNILDLMGPTLIVLDNLESLKNPEEIWEFLRATPLSTKALITSRHRIGYGEDVINMDRLSEEDSKLLLSEQLTLQSVSLKPQQIKDILSLVLGIPLAIKNIVGQIAVGRSPSNIINRLKEGVHDIQKFCFEGTFAGLSDDHKRVIYAISVMKAEPDFDEVQYISQIPPSKLEELIGDLKQVSLVWEDESEGRKVFKLDALTRLYGDPILERDTLLREEIHGRMLQLYEDYRLAKEVRVEMEKFRKIERLPVSNRIAAQLGDVAYRYAENKVYDRAEEYFEKAIKANPQEAYVWLMRAESAVNNLNDIKSAREYYQKAVDLNPHLTILKSWAEAEKNNGEYRASVKVLKMILEKEPNNAHYRYQLGYCYWAISQECNMRAKSDVNRAQRERAYSERNDMALEAYGCLKEAFLPSEGLYGWHNVRTAHVAAKCLARLQRFKDALEMVEKGLRFDTNDQQLLDFRKWLQMRPEVSEVS